MNTGLVIKSEGDDKPDQQMVWGEVYAPNRPDADDEFMTEDQIKQMAYKFLKEGRMGQIDVMHDNKIVGGCSVVESFIARKDDPVFIPGAWVVGVHVDDSDLWQKIKKGDINGFSMEALVTRHPKTVKIDLPPVLTGKTSKSEDHEHEFFVSYDDNGVFKGGMTSMVKGHTHQILAGTHTQPTEGHSHRFSSVDGIEILG